MPVPFVQCEHPQGVSVVQPWPCCETPSTRATPRLAGAVAWGARRGRNEMRGVFCALSCLLLFGGCARSPQSDHPSIYRGGVYYGDAVHEKNIREH